ncbi:MAG: sel1 repeat family protein, partial [Pseudomonadota bacterium]|nr:sel1 repeat family protein [Pseudomonadota bacterium]
GFARGECNVGYCFANGVGVQQDKVEAAQWYRKSAEQGYARGQFNLGRCYAEGSGVPQNAVEAMKWFRKAAKQNYGDAQTRLRLMYSKGAVVFNPLMIEDYFYDAFELECDEARDYLKLAANGEGTKILLATHFLIKLDYCKKCKENPSDFFEMMKKDPEFFGEWMFEYLFLHFLEQLNATQKIELSAYYYDHSVLPREHPVAEVTSSESVQKKQKTLCTDGLGETAILEDCREKAKQGQALSQKALMIEATNPIKAVEFFYQAYLTSSHQQACVRLWSHPTKITELQPLEKLNLDGTLEELFYRGLQNLAGIGVKHSGQTALDYFDAIIERSQENHAVSFVPHAQLWKGLIYMLGWGVQKDEARAYN